MKYLAEMDKLSGFEASIFGASLTIEVVKKTKSLFPVYIMDWGLVLRNNKHAEEYIRSDLFAEESQKLVNLILNKNLSFDFFKKVRKDVDNGIRKLDYFWKIRMKNLKQLSDKRFLDLYGKFIKDYVHYFGVGAVTYIYESHLAEKLMSELSPVNKKAESFIFSYIDSENKGYKSYMIEYEDSLRRLSMNNNIPMCNKIINNFFYIKSNYHDSKFLNKNAIKKDMEYLHINKRKHKTIPKIEISQFITKLNEEEKIILKILAKSLPLRDLRKRLNQTGQFILIRFLEEGLRRKSLQNKKDILLRMFWFEFKDFMKNPKKLEKKLLKRKNVSMGWVNNKVFYLEGIAIKKIRKDSKEILKGVIASKGKSKGIVKIVMGQKDFKKFNKGEILVSEATRPEFVPIMKKAAAVVTEEGGITSHAAIISRELKVPCIVGVSHITSILKDGDLVEVDANNGVIRILRK
ncbi:hypothetical protein J4458_04555 [Candidatus Woesearchaeota archaeon]|nr:hypothetical protein [Candidatus Woesearchaeota archaeon]